MYIPSLKPLFYFALYVLSVTTLFFADNPDKLRLLLALEVSGWVIVGMSLLMQYSIGIRFEYKALVRVALFVVLATLSVVALVMTDSPDVILAMGITQSILFTLLFVAFLFRLLQAAYGKYQVSKMDDVLGNSAKSDILDPLLPMDYVSSSASSRASSSRRSP